MSNQEQVPQRNVDEENKRDPVAGKNIILLDSSGPLHRCYHGYREPRQAMVDGHVMDVAALYGYCYYVRGFAYEFAFDHLVHVLDSPSGSMERFRMFPQYKAQRDTTPPPLVAQKALLPTLLESFGQLVVQKHGEEADDIIATLAKRYADRGASVLVISQDKDLMQLVEDGRVVMARYDQKADVNGHRRHHFISEKEVMEIKGVRPDQIADFLALVGDTSDNIPGAYRVGEKSAAKLLQEYGSLAALLTQKDDIKGALGKNIAAAAEVLPLYRRLTQTNDHLDIPDPDWNTKPNPELAEQARRILGVHAGNEFGLQVWPDTLLVHDRSDGSPSNAVADEDEFPVDAQEPVAEGDAPPQSHASPRSPGW